MDFGMGLSLGWLVPYDLVEWFYGHVGFDRDRYFICQIVAVRVSGRLCGLIASFFSKIGFHQLSRGYNLILGNR